MIGFIVIVWYFGNTFEEGSDNFKFKFRFGMHFYAIQFSSKNSKFKQNLVDISLNTIFIIQKWKSKVFSHKMQFYWH